MRPAASHGALLHGLASALVFTACADVEGPTASANRPPALEVASAFQTDEGQALTFTVRASDADEDVVHLTADGLPANAAFDTGTGGFAWTPSYSAARPAPYIITFTADDGRQSTQANVAITVLDVNQKPVLLLPGAQLGSEGALVTFNVSATDADPEDLVTITAADPPDGATFDGHTFRWTPGFDQAGPYLIALVATDNHLLSPPETATGQVSVTVSNTLAPPQGLTATPGDARVALDWQAADGAEEYTVYRAAVSGGPYTSLVTVSATSFLDEQLVNGTTWCYAVSSRAGLDESAKSGEACATPTSSKPVALAGLSATAGNGAVSLSWPAAAGAQSYVVYRGTSAADPGSFAALVPGRGYTDRGRSNGVTSYYRVTYVTLAGESLPTAAAPATPTFAAPLAPANLRAIPGNTEVGLSWDAVGGVSAYTVLRGADLGGPYSTVASAVVGATFTDTGLANDATYRYVVRANGSPASALSNEVSVRTSAALPVAPRGLVGVPGNGSVTLFWDASPGATRYGIYRPEGMTGGPYYLVAQAPSPVFTDTQPGGAKPYALTAVNEAGESPFSPELNVTPSSSLPATPANLQSRPGDGQVGLSWDAVGAATYRVHRAAGGDGFSVIADGLTAPRFLDESAANGVAYAYRVQAVAAEGGAWSQEVRATPRSALPTAPTDLTVTGGYRWARLEWTAVTGATGYLVYRADQESDRHLHIAMARAPFFVESGPAVEPRRHYLVSAVNDAGEGPWSDGASAASVSAVPLPPRGLFAFTGSKAGAISLVWKASGETVDYLITRGTSPGVRSVIAHSSAIAYTGFLDEGPLTPGTTYYYAIAATSSGSCDGATSCAAYSSEVNATTTMPPLTPVLAARPGNGQVTLISLVRPDLFYLALYRNPGGGFVFANNFSGMYTDVSLGNGTTYRYFARTSPDGASSPEVSVTPDDQLPYRPNYFELTPGNGQMGLAWRAPQGGADSYAVYRATGDGATHVPIATTTATTLLDTGLENGTPLSYVVAAVNGAGESAFTSTQEGAPDATVPGAVQGLWATPGNGQNTLRWEPVPGADEYAIWGHTIDNGSYYMTQTSRPLFTIGAGNGSQFIYQVRAAMKDCSDCIGRPGAVSGDVSATPSSALPATPAGLSATAGHRQIRLRWDVSADGATAYRIYRAGPAEPFAEIARTPVSWFVDSALADGVTQLYAVSAVKASGESAFAGPVGAAPDSRLLPAPASLETLAGSRRSTVVWSPVPGAPHYRVCRGTAPGPGGTSTCGFATGASHTEGSLQNGATRYSTVQSCIWTMESTCGSASAEVSATPSTGGLTSPSSLAIDRGNAEMSLSWQPSTGASGYKVYRAAAAGGPYLLAGSVAGGPFTERGLAVEAPAFYVVTATSSPAESAFSAEISATPVATVPRAPTDLSATVEGGAVHLAWSAAIGADSYRVCRSEVVGDPSPVCSDAAAAGLVDFNVSSGTVYHYLVRACRGSDCGAYSNGATAEP